jgi:acyl-CoA reductase-like NAD-dependent aldehyde dehydrogenase
VALPSAEQVDAAIAAAGAAARGWADTPAVERCELLHEVAARLRANADALAELMTREGGKPLVENTDEVGWTAAAFDYYAEMGRNFAGRVIPTIESTQLALVLKEPLGVVAAIVPWNYPLLLLAWKLAPALAAGNTVVCKPSELTPLSTLALAPCLDHLPPGVVGLLAGAGDVGEALVGDERVDGVAFTGSVQTGKRIEVRCAERVARINLEMGGEDPIIVCADVAVDAAVAAGAELVTGGDDGGQGTGHFFAPTVVTGVPAQTDLLREETFGPVAPIVPVASLDEAIALANSTRFGLGANVYTRDLETVARCMREIKAGTVWFNDPLTDNDAGPFGGYKPSGLGRELGQEGLDAFQETKHVHIETKIAAKSWWYPYGATA